jgi:hypothetical protein
MDTGHITVGALPVAGPGCTGEDAQLAAGCPPGQFLLMYRNILNRSQHGLFMAAAAAAAGPPATIVAPIPIILIAEKMPIA